MDFLFETKTGSESSNKTRGKSYYKFNIVWKTHPFELFWFRCFPPIHTTKSLCVKCRCSLSQSRRKVIRRNKHFGVVRFMRQSSYFALMVSYIFAVSFHPKDNEFSVSYWPRIPSFHVHNRMLLKYSFWKCWATFCRIQLKKLLVSAHWHSTTSTHGREPS